MIRQIPFTIAVRLMLALLVLVLGYHLLIITGTISYTAAWGGRLKSDEEMYVFESVSIVINILLMAIIAIKGGYVKSIKAGKGITVVLWIMVVVFAINTLGNIFAVTLAEALIATPLTFLSAVLCWRMAIEKQPTY